MKYIKITSMIVGVACVALGTAHMILGHYDQASCLLIIGFNAVNA